MSARALYLELSALRIDVRTDCVPANLALAEGLITLLLERLREKHAELCEILVGDTPELDAIRAEGGAR